MHIRAGYEISYECPQETAMILTLTLHPSRVNDMLTPGPIVFSPGVTPRVYEDRYGNIVTRITALPGITTISTDFVVEDSGRPDPVNWSAQQHPIHELPDDMLVYLLGSRYCETDRLSDIAWGLFGGSPQGWGRVQAICDFVHNHIRFGYQDARSTRTAWEGYQERVGVCRDFAHLAVAFCRCMNIPARYCTGYLGDIGVPRSPDPMDFSAWFEAYLGGRWYTFDARHNAPRIGRLLIGRGRDATDVAISSSFGPARLVKFDIVTDEVVT